MTSETITLRITGPGRHKITTDVSPISTVGDLKQYIAQETSHPAMYLKLIARGKKIEENDDSATLTSVGLEHRTSIMCMHNERYVQDQKGVQAIQEIVKKIENLEAQKDDMQPIEVHELVTQICCRLDGVETNGSDALRQFRKQAIARAEALDTQQTDKE
mmetsp:Transcript_14170/g.18471  ORF Transcript_14170/g.18471 Transcript_14170/m.18471 type:complete len:160 (+) Transcript_14170:101-580(+)|eukprot:CAMPEP_0198153528 /NCGR_PEP_ID=MMETSP1443-20131203/64641_1 /TAXON_ID=186043 /ORGANISM="Entomoneis sp., Strain CCMP2396" /LENGTH=159 /DNA_ID=CAMNT_0043819909 /DNA_START=83 /DNA_END=562 /DNA_ORIENTATION=+